MGGRYGHQSYTVVSICCILVIGVSAVVTKLGATPAPRAWAASVHHSLAYSTYFGDQYGAANAIAHDAAGNVYVGGDGYFIKFAPAGGTLMHVRFSGVVNGIAVDRQGNIYITGYTDGFSTRHAFQAQPGGGEDAFVAKFNRAGTMVYGTYYGGESTDVGMGIVVDAKGHAYITGSTYSRTLPARHQSPPHHGDADAFVAMVDPGGKLLYSTRLGGGANDEGHGIALDGHGNVFVTGWTASRDFPVVGASRPDTPGAVNVFVSELDPTGHLVDSTYFGGKYMSWGYAIAVDGADNVYVAGGTLSPEFPIKGGLQSTNAGGEDGFVVRFDRKGTMTYGTYLGGENTDEVTGLALGGHGKVYVTGQTSSANFPAAAGTLTVRGDGYCGRDDATHFCTDAFVTGIDTNTNSMIFSRYLGGDGDDEGHGIVEDGRGNIYVVGMTASRNFPTSRAMHRSNPGPPDSFHGGAIEGFIAKLMAVRGMHAVGR